MDRRELLALLPEVHAEALRLRDDGMDGAYIAERLGIPTEAVGPLIQVAEAKLRRFLVERER